MSDFEDPWWAVAVVGLVLCWIMGIVIPVRMAAAPLGIAKQYADVEDDTTQQTPPPPPKPGLGLPITVLVVSLALTALSLGKRIVEPEGGNRWLWLCAAAGAASFWVLALVMLIMRMRGRAA